MSDDYREERPAQHASAHDHGAAFQQSHGVQIYFASRDQEPNTGIVDAARGTALSSLPRVRDCSDPIAWGVHPAPSLNGDRVPPYVERDIDFDLASLLRPGSFVLLTGDSTAGKSRCAYEALISRFGDRFLYRPQDGGDLARGMAHLEKGNLTIWLDDLERFLSPPAVTGEMIDAALQAGAVVIGTIRAEQLSLVSPRMMPGQNSQLQASLRNSRGVISRSHVIYLDRRWSEQEIARVRGVDDPRLKDAVRHSSEVGIAEYLAAGPQLMLDWRSAWAPGLNPRGASLVAAAVDFRRIGIGWPIPRQVLLGIHDEYLKQRGGARLRPESTQDAFHWATQPLHATSSLLIPDGDDAYVAFDYLPDAISREHNSPRPPDFIWEYAIETLPPKALHFIGHKAEEFGRVEIAEKAYALSADAGMGEGSFHLGYFATQRGEPEEAEYWFRRAISQGNLLAHANLAITLQQNGRPTEALEILRTGASKGDHASAHHLASLYVEEKNWIAAEDFFEGLLETRPSMAKMILGRLKLDQGSYDTAWDWLNAAVLDGNNEAYFYLGRLHEERGDVDSAEESYEIATLHGFARARNNLATLLYRARRLEDAERILRAVSQKDSRAAFNLAIILGETGRESEAEDFYRSCIESGSISAKTNLAVLISRQGRESEAMILLREAASAGDSHAMYALAGRFRRARNTREALSWCNKAIEAGSVDSYSEMGLIQESMGNAKAARFWYRRGVELGDMAAAVCLGYLMERSGKHKEAIRLYERAAEGGSSHAYFHIGKLHARKRNLNRAVPALESALDQGEDVAELLMSIYDALGEHEKRNRLAAKGGNS